MVATAANWSWKLSGPKLGPLATEAVTGPRDSDIKSSSRGPRLLWRRNKSGLEGELNFTEWANYCVGPLPGALILTSLSIASNLLINDPLRRDKNVNDFHC